MQVFCLLVIYICRKDIYIYFYDICFSIFHLKFIDIYFYRSISRYILPGVEDSMSEYLDGSESAVFKYYGRSCSRSNYFILGCESRISKIEIWNSETRNSN